MKDITLTSTQLISNSYMSYHHSVYQYIYYKINSREDAEDLSQDVFLRLMEYKQMLRPDTVKCFILTIARNLVTDYLRRYYKKQEMTSYMYDNCCNSTNDMEERIIVDDLLVHEKYRVSLLPSQRQKIYVMNRFEDKTAFDISNELGLSRRTVENHLLISRREVRDYMQYCV